MTARYFHGDRIAVGETDHDGIDWAAELAEVRRQAAEAKARLDADAAARGWLS